MAEDIQSLADRPGWTVTGEVATYAPQPGGWTARVRSTREAKYYARWHVAIIDPAGCARHVSHASLLGEAIRVAEGRVRGQNGVSGDT